MTALRSTARRSHAKLQSMNSDEITTTDRGEGGSRTTVKRDRYRGGFYCLSYEDASEPLSVYSPVLQMRGHRNVKAMLMRGMKLSGMARHSVRSTALSKPFVAIEDVTGIAQIVLSLHPKGIA